MTDDDRMDRARRIREMREGDRPDSVQTDDDPEAPDTRRGQGTGDTPRETDAGEPADADGDVPVGDASDLPGVELDQTLGDSGAAGGDDRAVEAERQVGAETATPAAGAGAGAASAGDPSPGDEPTGGPAGMASARGTGVAVETTAETRVLEFELGTERYCLDIEHVEEIVKRETVTRVPNTPEYVEGVVDLRGQITTILDPKVLLDIDSEGSKELIVVFDPDKFEDQGAIGWVVDDVTQVTPVHEGEVNDSPVEADHINGVVERDGRFVIWTQPAVAIESAAG